MQINTHLISLSRETDSSAINNRFDNFDFYLDRFWMPGFSLTTVPYAMKNIVVYNNGTGVTDQKRGEHMKKIKR